MLESYPLVSILIPTLNSALVLEDCLKSVSDQSYPKNKVEVIVADGGSTDSTLELAKKYGANIVSNKLKTGEAGKMAALKVSKGVFVVLIDSDNILPDKDWLEEMISPLLMHPEAVGSEPWEYIRRKEDGFITRYCALMGMNDPLVYFLGNYDRRCFLSGKWTEVSHNEKDYGKYILAEFDKRGIPTIGANGTVFRSDFLRDNTTGDYLFDIDILSSYIKAKGKVHFIKVKTGIVHTFCESDIFKFARKQKRRAKDYFYYKSKNNRSFEWTSSGMIGKNIIGYLKFVFYCLTVIPLFLQALYGFYKKNDFAWFFHPLACEITLCEYGWVVLTSIFRKEELCRSGWKQ